MPLLNDGQQPSTSSGCRSIRKSASMETLWTPARNHEDLVNVNLRRGTGAASRLPILRKPASLESLHEALKHEAKHGSKSAKSYTSVVNINNDRFILLMRDVLGLLLQLQVPNVPESVSQYKSLLVDQYLRICVATLSKMIKVDYGKRKDEMISTILHVTKALQCPIRISKLQLINPMSSSSIKICTLFLHWICCRVHTFVSRSRRLDNETRNDKEFFTQLFNHHSRLLEGESGTFKQTDSLSYCCHSRSLSVNLSTDANNNSTIDGDRNRTFTNTLEAENAVLETRLETLLRQNEETRKELAELKAKRQGNACCPEVTEHKKLKLEHLRRMIDFQREMMQMQSSAVSAAGQSFERGAENSELTTSQERTFEPDVDEYYRAQLARLEELELECQRLLLNLYQLYAETRLHFPEFAFLTVGQPGTLPGQLTLDHYTRWLEAMDSALSIAADEADELQRKDFKLKNAVTINKLAAHFRMTPDEVVGIESKLREVKQQLANEKEKQNSEASELQRQLDSVSFQIHELSFVNRSKEDKYHCEVVLRFS